MGEVVHKLAMLCKISPNDPGVDTWQHYFLRKQPYTFFLSTYDPNVALYAGPTCPAGIKVKTCICWGRDSNTGSGDVTKTACHYDKRRLLFKIGSFCIYIVSGHKCIQGEDFAKQLTSWHATQPTTLCAKNQNIL
jgi:hypothetical protein